MLRRFLSAFVSVNLCMQSEAIVKGLSLFDTTNKFLHGFVTSGQKKYRDNWALLSPVKLLSISSMLSSSFASEQRDADELKRIRKS